MSNTDETKELFPYRIPSNVQDCSKGQLSSCESIDVKPNTTTPTLVRSLVNPSMAATAHLHVQYITLPPHFELPPRKARAVEFYYVISGSGVMSQQGIPERQPLNTGDCCVVDAHHMRWIKNTNGTNLVVLRATDGATIPDRIRKDPNHRSRLEAPVSMIANGLKTLQNTANQLYISSSGSSTAEKNSSESSKPAKVSKATTGSSNDGTSGTRIFGQRPLNTMSQ